MDDEKLCKTTDDQSVADIESATSRSVDQAHEVVVSLFHKP